MRQPRRRERTTNRGVRLLVAASTVLGSCVASTRPPVIAAAAALPAQPTPASARNHADERGSASSASASASAESMASASIERPAAARPPPAGLTCLSQWYPVHVSEHAGIFYLVMPDGTEISEGSVLAMYVAPYPHGAIAPITEAGLDPGAVRVEAMFRQTYGRNERDVTRALTSVKLAGHLIAVHKKAAPAFERAAARVHAAIARQPSLAKYFEHLGGTFNWRPIAGTDELSLHAYGIALDIDTWYSDYWRNDSHDPPRWKNRIPQAVVDAFEAEGFVWGGRWFYYDTMHFEYRPELLDPSCRAK
jgi:hypothetical protein